VAEPVPPKPYYRAVFISPHLDDAVFSCGGTMARLLREGPVLVLNIFTGYLSDLKIHGAVLGAERYREELDAAKFMGFESHNLGELDAPFRRAAYRHLGNIFHPPVAEDLAWLADLRAKVFGVLEQISFQELYAPLGTGWHVDHVLTHMLFDTWGSNRKLVYYEDAPYCCIPHATRYRLNDIAYYDVPAADFSLRAFNEFRGWWQAARAYADTALMKNLQPRIVRKCAVPAVGYYLYRLMALHRKLAPKALKRQFRSRLVPVSPQDLERKVDAMMLYTSQFNEFFATREDCLTILGQYAAQFGVGGGAIERVWSVVRD